MFGNVLWPLWRRQRVSEWEIPRELTQGHSCPATLDACYCFLEHTFAYSDGPQFDFKRGCSLELAAQPLPCSLPQPSRFWSPLLPEKSRGSTLCLPNPNHTHVDQGSGLDVLNQSVTLNLKPHFSTPDSLPWWELSRALWVRNSTHPDPKLHILASVDFHAFVQQANLLEVLPVHNEAANEGRAPAGAGEMGQWWAERLSGVAVWGVRAVRPYCQEDLVLFFPLLPEPVWGLFLEWSLGLASPNHSRKTVSSGQRADSCHPGISFSGVVLVCVLAVNGGAQPASLGWLYL